MPNKPEKFMLTEAHLQLIRNMHFEMNDHVEFGAPCIDPKRPYGNSDVLYDIAMLIENINDPGDWACEWCKECDVYEMCDEAAAYYQRLHEETLTVFQIIQDAVIIPMGAYMRSAGKHGWDKGPWHYLEGENDEQHS